ncbi:alpha-amylase family glycosyl hydrolase [Gynuella sp.]|uniref:alpha-amylase family glycosyl hydrolase n=1 Tax=Gynuella sp. TaxID=2969146 RepID=UPI003D1194F0
MQENLVQTAPHSEWWMDSVFYHIYPLGFCDAPEANNFTDTPVHRIEKVYEWLDHLQELGITAIYFGPLFESSYHGYDTADFFQIDRRLGDFESLAALFREMHKRHIKVVLDGVFNHVGRDFWAFQDLQKNLQNSAYKDWFVNVDFSGTSPYGDSFCYEGWEGHYNLVKLNLHNDAVCEHLFTAIKTWVDKLDIDGLRLDVAYCLDKQFLKKIRHFATTLKTDFWLMGEMIHGDYNQWVNQDMLHSGTNYECFKGLYSSHNDINYFEIAYSLNRLFGSEGIYKELSLFNFVDNHDVNRVASLLKKTEHLYPLYCLLFTIPGIPSIYYGSEWGIYGEKTDNSDAALRPNLDLNFIRENARNKDLSQTIGTLAAIRKSSQALKRGDYLQLTLTHEQFSFRRNFFGDEMVVLVNSAAHAAGFDISLPDHSSRQYVDLLNGGDVFQADNGRLHVPEVHPHWCRILHARD